MAELIRVAEVYLVKDGQEFTGLELGWTDAVLNAEGAAGVLDALRANMDSAAWTTAIVTRAEAKANGGAETVEGAGQDGGGGAGDDVAGD